MWGDAETVLNVWTETTRQDVPRWQPCTQPCADINGISHSPHTDAADTFVAAGNSVRGPLGVVRGDSRGRRGVQRLRVSLSWTFRPKVCYLGTLACVGAEVERILPPLRP